MRRRPDVTAFWLVVAMLLLAPSTRAESNLDVDVLLLGGKTSYRIDIWGEGASLLDFSFVGRFAGLSVSHRVTGKAKLEGTLWGRLSADAGTLEDSDWFYGDGHPGVDIFSVSDLSLDNAFVGSVGMALTDVIRDWLAVDALLGYAHGTLAFTGSNTQQVGYGPYWYYTTSLSGPVIRYSVTYGLPYIGLRARLDPRLKLDVLFSPLVSARDRDDHLRREEEYPPGSGRITDGKLSEGSATGTAWIIELLGVIPLDTGSKAPSPPPPQMGKDIREWGPDLKEWTLQEGRLRPPQPPPATEASSARWNLVVKVRRLSISAQGTQRQWYYYPDGSTIDLASGIPLTLTSQQTAVVAALRIDF